MLKFVIAKKLRKEKSKNVSILTVKLNGFIKSVLKVIKIGYVKDAN